jgi:predicted acyl esterase
MAVNMWRRMPRHAVNRLYLSMGGHAAPSAPDAVEKDKLRDQLAYFDFVLRRKPLRLPVVTYWTRDPKVQVPADAFKYPKGAWERHTASSWPPPRMVSTPFALSGDGLLTAPKTAKTAALPLAGAQADPGSDGVLQAAFSATPLGATPLAPGTAGTNSPGAVAGFTGPAATGDRQLSGRTTARLRWTPNVPDTQVVLKLWDRAPDGTLTLFARGVRGLRNATPGADRTLTFSTNDYSLELNKGHAVLVTVTAGDASFYKPYPGSSAGGTLTAGPASTVTLPLRSR